MDPYQRDTMNGDIESEYDGEGFKDFVGAVKRAKIGKKIIKFAKDTKLVKKLGNALVDRAIKTIAGGEIEKRKRGRPKKSGGALMPAGY